MKYKNQILTKSFITLEAVKIYNSETGKEYKDLNPKTQCFLRSFMLLDIKIRRRYNLLYEV